jgi:hypothetical protein
MQLAAAELTQKGRAYGALPLALCYVRPVVECMQKQQGANAVGRAWLTHS